MTAPKGGMVKRLHIVLVPGFGGFDVLGQLRYYAGVTPLFQAWREDRPVTLHYFDNFPTASVKTRARLLGDELGKLVQRREIQDEDEIVLVGHSTGGLDIRQLVLDLDAAEHPQAVTTPKPTPDAGVSRVEPMLHRIRGIVFLSVPHFGTNIADWCAAREGQITPLLRALHRVVDWRDDPWFQRARPLIPVGLAVLDRLKRYLLEQPSDLFDHAIPDVRRETLPSSSDDYNNATARAAAAELQVWLAHAAEDTRAIEDLRAVNQFGDRARERELWARGGIKTRSYATIGRAPSSRFRRDSTLASVVDLKDAAAHVSKHSDPVYRVAYTACASGPLLDRKDLPETPARWFESRKEYLPRAWENDGIANTLSMLWPDGPDTLLVSADHGDIIGHHTLTPIGTHGRRDAYDLLGSDSGFKEPRFKAIWTDIFEFCVDAIREAGEA
jgi:hypothetical protein